MDKTNHTKKDQISRRDFLQSTALAFGAVAIRPGLLNPLAGSFPENERLGRIPVGRVDIKLRPDYDAPNVGIYYEDAVVPWHREVLGIWPYRNNQRWVETDDGYIWSPDVQPVKNIPNTPILEIPQDTDGVWVEVTVPWIDVVLDNPPAISSWWIMQTKKKLPARFYYSQILWVDTIEADSNGQIWYRINELYGNPGDIFWGPAEAFRAFSSSDLDPISPEVENKQIVVDVTGSHQTLACFEDGREVHFCRISSGRKPNTTPLSAYGSPGFHVWRKTHSLQMSGGTNQAGWMIPGVGWTTFFLGDGIAIHSTFWHNNFGEASSHGCVNASPEDAKWIFRWSTPVTPYQKGDIIVSGTIGTPIKIIEY
jgi:lipoprotein-anchoring transpeptidase ErfK/SrfK